MKNFKYQYQKDEFLRENLDPDADKRTIKEHLEKQNKGRKLTFQYIGFKTFRSLLIVK